MVSIQAEGKIKNESSESALINEQGDERDEEKVHALRDINLDILKGSFTMIVGDIGSGKSTLLQAIINETLVEEGTSISLSGQVAYSPQKPWIMSTTLK